MIGTDMGRPLTLRRMERRDEPHLQALYENSFPPAERRPWGDVVVCQSVSFGPPVVPEVEIPEGDEDDMTRRRVRFYERCGFMPFPSFRYIQPPYSPGLPSLELMLMASSESVSLEEATRLLHTHVYGVDCR